MVLCFAILQLLCLLIWGYTPYPDSNDYLPLARQSVLEHGIYPTASQMHELPFIWNLGAINTLVGSLYAFHSVYPVHILYILMKSISAWLVFQIAKHLTNDTIAFIALCVYVLYPANYGEANSFLSEVPFTFFTLLSVYMFLKEKYMACGLCLAIGNWYRPLSLVLLAILILLVVYQKKRHSFKYIGRIVGVYLFFSISVGFVNYHNTGRFFSQAHTGWMNLMRHSWINDQNKEADYALFERHHPMYVPNDNCIDPITRDHVWRDHFFIWLSNNKLEYLRQMPYKLVKTYISDNTTFCTFLQDKKDIPYLYSKLSMITLVKEFPQYTVLQWLVVYNLMYYYALLLLAAIGAYLLLRKREVFHFILLFGMVLLYTLFIIIIAGKGESRFHIPLMPYFIILAYIAIFGLKIRRGKRT